MSTRRHFLRQSVLAAVGAAVGSRLSGCATSDSCCCGADGGLFNISLAEWSLHRSIKGGQVNHLDFASIAKWLGMNGVEYVNQFFMDKATDSAYLAEMKMRAESEGVASVLIMCDREGNLGDPDEKKRAAAVENHHKWVAAAKTLGCHSIRVNAASDPKLSFEEQQKLAADGLRRLCEFADPHAINVIVENHGGLSSNGAWLAGVMKLVDHPRVGTLPDFGNFRLSARNAAGPEQWYDRYQGVAELMPFAKGVSAKSHEFDAHGEEVRTDFRRMLKIVLDAGYRGWIGIEYEGDKHPEQDGIVLTRQLLERVRQEMSAA
jgi:sugar phosphate isomerase/epimerase